MLSAEMNERLTRVGPGTPMGELLRRYWHAFAATTELKDKRTKHVRLLGEDLALFKDGEGRYGLLAENCPHRRVSLVYGVPEDEGIRCPYHGWMFDTEGNCLEQPAESPNSTFKNRVKTVAYPVKEQGGLLFAYMGPAPAPELPHFDLFTQPNALRQIRHTLLPINWLQAMENSLDPTHSEWLHSYYSVWLNTGMTASQLGGFPQMRHAKIGFDLFEFGIIKRRYYEGGSEADPEWAMGHPVVFPNFLKIGTQFQIRVPVDDTHTDEIRYDSFAFPGVEVPEQDHEDIPCSSDPYLDENGEHLLKQVREQDQMAWVTQGAIADRTVEHLGASDRGVLMYRKILQEQILAVAEGRDPFGTIRDPKDNPPVIDLPIEGRAVFVPQGPPGELETRLRRQFGSSPICDQLVELHLRAYGIAEAS